MKSYSVTFRHNGSTRTVTVSAASPGRDDVQDALAQEYGPSYRSATIVSANAR